MFSSPKSPAQKSLPPIPIELLILLGGLLWRGIIAFWLFPGYDEAYYYLYSQHLDWSYFDHPVLVALTTGFGPRITGVVSQFTIRLGSLILYTGSLWLLYLTSRWLFNVQAARLTLAIASLIPIFQVGFGVLTLPDSPLIFFWSATLLCAAKEFFPLSPPERPTYRLAILGVLVGLTCLGKYHGFILGLGLIGFSLTSPPHRRVFLSPWTILGLSLFILTLFPLWFWNIQHDWISLTFQLSSRFQPEPGIPKSGYNFLGVIVVFLAGIGYLFPTFGVPLWWISFRSLIAKNNHKYLFILWVSLPLTIGFTLLGGKEQILAGWPMPGFWGLTLILGQYAQSWSQVWVRHWLKNSAIAIISLLLLILLHITTGIWQKPGEYAFFGGFLSPKNDPSTELIDIRQLRRGFTDSPVLSAALANSHFVFTNAYYLGGLIEMALQPLTAIPVTCFSEDLRGFAFWWQPDQWIGKDALYITLERFHQMPQLTNEFRRYFKYFEEIGTIPMKRGGVVTEVFHVYQATHYQLSINAESPHDAFY
ncbi:MAG: glycosyltransferase family 39 protein [Gomphosphaeria aponina SAG 52.96 = DSM 107014]|uniref:Glycosyltransferase family 39 protein n=1 Tax=Gomphosphaeria aponina SAG 52.96 = DSM 107014 TaxID=1521640 RepID=A0A941GRT5_9CHRO|nr:glycosyltransferase family 39 protein [Gomphosphaeria aponina SAG 52.96 = DSM 107014]